MWLAGQIHNIFWLLALTIISTQNVFAQSANELLADDKAWKWAPPRHGLKSYIFTKMTSKEPFEYLAVDYIKLPLGKWQYEVPYTGLPSGYSIVLTGQRPQIKPKILLFWTLLCRRSLFQRRS
jgi:hypothetical protein